jgi:glycosyltransferase involved in cell wall biosynthesis
MKIIILADPSSSHTIKWVNSLHKKGLEIFLFGLSKYDPAQYDCNIRIESLRTPDNIKKRLDGSFSKIIYLSAFPMLKRIIREFKPDIIHAHYAASYGFIAALSGFHPFILSVWGIDILTFPTNSFLHKKLISFTLKKADKIFATSNYLARETQKYTENNIQVIPFGIDINKFKPISKHSIYLDNEIIIGTVKSMENKYGIDYLIKSFALVKKKHSDINLKLLLVGGGSLEQKYKTMISELDLSESATFTGQVAENDVIDFHNQLTIAVYLSTVESFGVSVLESSACEKAVIVSNVGGLPEVVKDGITGIIVKPRDVNMTADAIERLILDPEYRIKLGKAGRKRVMELFNWDENVNDMIGNYKVILRKNVSEL